MNYGRNDWNLALRWRHLPEAIDGNEVVAGAASTLRGAEEDYDIFDLSGTLDLRRQDEPAVRHRQPVRHGAGVDGPAHVGGPLAEHGLGHDRSRVLRHLGRTFYVGVSLSF